MANPHHLNIWYKGRKAWHEWRDDNKSINPDLSNISDLGLPRGEPNLDGYNLYRTNLSGTVLTGISLDKVILKESNLQESIITNCTLRNANLIGVDLNSSDLRGSNFEAARLEDAIMENTTLGLNININERNDQWYLYPSNFRRAQMKGARLRGVSLGKAQAVDEWGPLGQRNIYQEPGSRPPGWPPPSEDEEPELANAWSREDLSVAACFAEANLSEADFREAKLWLRTSGVDFRRASLLGALFDGADITNARLWGTLLDGWSIRNIRCSAASWDRDGDQLRYYEQGAFERAYSKAYLIHVEYPGGITTLEMALLPLTIESLQKQYRNCRLYLKSVEDQGDSAIVTVSAQALDEDLSGAQIAEMAGKLETFRRCLAEEKSLREKSEVQLEYATRIIELIMKERNMSGSKTYNIHGNVSNVGDIGNQAKVSFDQNNYSDPLAIEKIKQIVVEFYNKKDFFQSDLSKEEVAKIEASVAAVDIEVQKPNPNHSIIYESLGFLKKVAENAAGSLAASTIKAMLGQF